MTEDPQPPALASSSGTGGVGGGVTLLSSRRHYRYGIVILGILGAVALLSSDEGLLQNGGLLVSLSPSTISVTNKEEPGQQQVGGDMRSSMTNRSNSSTSTNTSTRTGHTTAPVRDMVGEWLGQTWVPPHPWRLFGPTELLQMYQDKKVLWIGDSTGRRAFATMYAILQETAVAVSSNNTIPAPQHHVSTRAMDHHTVIDVNKKVVTESCTKWSNETVAEGKLKNLPYPTLCRPVPSNVKSSSSSSRRGEFSFAVASCYSSIENLLTSELAGMTNITADVDLIVIALGIWEVMRKGDCNHLEKVNNYTTTRQNALQRLDYALQASVKLARQTGKTILWRTAGYGFGATIAPMNVLNNQTMGFIDGIRNVSNSNNNFNSSNNSNNIMYVNWGGAVQPRSFGDDNIVGDIVPHYGLAARLVAVQMITNRLHDAGFFDNE